MKQARAGDIVILNGYTPSKIRTTTVKRTVLASKRFNGTAWYNLAIGTNTSGISSHWFNANRIVSVVVSAPQPRVLSARSRNNKPFARCANVRTRDYQRRLAA